MANNGQYQILANSDFAIFRPKLLCGMEPPRLPPIEQQVENWLVRERAKNGAAAGKLTGQHRLDAEQEAQQARLAAGRMPMSLGVWAAVTAGMPVAVAATHGSPWWLLGCAVTLWAMHAQDARRWSWRRLPVAAVWTLALYGMALAAVWLRDALGR